MADSPEPLPEPGEKQSPHPHSSSSPTGVETPITPPGGRRSDPKAPAGEKRLRLSEMRAAWPFLSRAERLEGFRLLARVDQERLYFRLHAPDKAELVLSLPNQTDRRAWIRLLDPNDAAELLRAANAAKREGLFALLDERTKLEVNALLAYAEDKAGGLMNPRYARVRPEMTADEAILYLREQTRETAETISYLYVLDADQKLLGVMSVRDLIAAPVGKKMSEIMRTEVVTAPAEADQEALSLVFAQNKFIAIPVVDAENRMKGIVTADDIVQVVQEEATEDIQKVGGTQALSAPYLRVSWGEMVRKRAPWLAILFLGEMLTASALGWFEHEIAKAVVLTFFIPLIISSGGNSGSQATTLVIRAMALGEIRLADWWRVVSRELATGLALGAFVGAIGLLRIVLGEQFAPSFGANWFGLALTVSLSLVVVVLFGTLVGSMLPFLLRRFRLDPASASAPLVATLSDVSGLVIYFSIAHFLFLR